MGLPKVAAKFSSNISLNILFIYNLVNIIIAGIFYPLLPIILDYPPGSIEENRLGISYTEQYLLIVALILLISSLVLKKALGILGEYNRITAAGGSLNPDQVKLIKRKGLNLPYLIYILQILFPVAIMSLIFVIVGVPLTVGVRLIIIIFTFTTLGAIITLIFSKRNIARMLIASNLTDTVGSIRISLRNKIFLYIVPMFMVAVLFTSLIGYSRLIVEKGDWIYYYYQRIMADRLGELGRINDITAVKLALYSIDLKDLKAHQFIITPAGKVVTSDNAKLDRFFIRYIKDHSQNSDHRIYGTTGEIQGMIKQINIDNQVWTVGIEYQVPLNQTILFFLMTFLILLVINIYVLAYSSKVLTDDIVLVTRSLSEIAQGENVNLDQKLSVSSNDEIGDLIIAFNKILDLEKANLATAKELAATRERNRFARDIHDTLGQALTLLLNLLRIGRININDPQKTEEFFSKATKIAQTGLNDVRRSLAGLTPEKLEAQNLLKALRGLIADYQSPEVAIDFSVTGFEDCPDPAAADVIYRICQEALTNSLRHGRARQINIILDFAAGWLRLFIFDNGSGCKQIKPGFGLTSMAARVTELNGKITYGSDGESGFNIRVEVPLER